MTTVNQFNDSASNISESQIAHRDYNDTQNQVNDNIAKRI